MSKSLKCWLGLHLVAWLGTALSVLLLAAAVALLKTLSLQYLSLWSMADVSTALAGLAAAAGEAKTRHRSRRHARERAETTSRKVHSASSSSIGTVEATAPRKLHPASLIEYRILLDLIL